jgi:hypothetical protein
LTGTTPRSEQVLALPRPSSAIPALPPPSASTLSPITLDLRPEPIKQMALGRKRKLTRPEKPKP